MDFNDNKTVCKHGYIESTCTECRDIYHLKELNKHIEWLQECKNYLEKRNLKLEKALNYFTSPEVYEEYEVNGITLMKPVLLNGLKIATEALKVE